jgi:hypothetical protein
MSQPSGLAPVLPISLSLAASRHPVCVAASLRDMDKIGAQRRPLLYVDTTWYRVTMPMLIAHAWTTAHPVMPCVWICSECSAVFDVGPLRRARLTREQIIRVNSQFEEHCKHVHSRSLPVIGLNKSS